MKVLHPSRCWLLISTILGLQWSCDLPSESNSQSITLDPIDTIPAWMENQVEQLLPGDGMYGWIPTGDWQSSSMIKVPRFPISYEDYLVAADSSLFPFVFQPTQSELNLKATVVRNERFSGQIAVASTSEIKSLHVEIVPLFGPQGHEISRDDINIRYVGYVPVQRGASEYSWSARHEAVAGHGTAGMLDPIIVGDPLWELPEVDVPPHRTQPIWISIDVPTDVVPGPYTGVWKALTADGASLEMRVALDVLDAMVPPVDQSVFFLDFWLNPDAIAVQYDVPRWSDRHWELLEAYLRDYAALGGKTITAAITHEPWRIPGKDGVYAPQTYTGFSSLVNWTRRADGEWDFDYSIFDRYVELAIQCGITDRINAYSLTAFRGPERIHYWDEQTNSLKEEQFPSVMDAHYQKVWGVFLTDFRDHLAAKGWLDMTYLAFDERPEETMQAVTRFIGSVAPGFSDRITIAGHPESDAYATGALSIAYEFFPGQNLASDHTLPIINRRRAASELTTFYLCGQPAHPNTLTVSPAVEARMIPWLALKYHTDGYLRWAYNSWTKEPFREPALNFIQGDDYLIYPGPEGPMSSIRREVLLDGLEDYALFSRLSSNQEGKHFQQAVELATRSEDGRHKDLQDVIRARRIILDLQE